MYERKQDNLSFEKDWQAGNRDETRNWPRASRKLLYSEPRGLLRACIQLRGFAGPFAVALATRLVNNVQLVSIGVTATHTEAATVEGDNGLLLSVVF